MSDAASAARRAGAAAPVWAATSARERARLLRAAADALDANRAGIVRVADFETGLGEARFLGEPPRPDLRRMLVPLGPVGVVNPPGIPRQRDGAWEATNHDARQGQR